MHSNNNGLMLNFSTLPVRHVYFILTLRLKIITSFYCVFLHSTINAFLLISLSDEKETKFVSWKTQSDSALSPNDAEESYLTLLARFALRPSSSMVWDTSATTVMSGAARGVVAKYLCGPIR